MSLRWLVIFAFIVGVGLFLRNRSSSPQRAVASSNDPTRDVAKVFRSMASTMPATAPSDKPWVANPSGFIADRDGDRSIGHSLKPCLSADEALQSARADAIAGMAHVLREKLSRYHTDSGWVASRIGADIDAGELQLDSFTEKFERPYGTIWTASVLLDASAEKLDPIIARYVGQLRAERAHVQRVRFGAVVAVATAWLLYVVLNAITKGYFTARLRFGALAITALAIILLP
jgi:hypothetical protein